MLLADRHAPVANAADLLGFDQPLGAFAQALLGPGEILKRLRRACLFVFQGAEHFVDQPQRHDMEHEQHRRRKRDGGSQHHQELLQFRAQGCFDPVFANRRSGDDQRHFAREGGPRQRVLLRDNDATTCIDNALPVQQPLRFRKLYL
ncbi:MAG: hypothetical protein ACRCUC_10300, partial [Aestuariivirga sp.]